MQMNDKLYLPDYHNLIVYQKAMNLVDSIKVLREKQPLIEQQRLWKLATSIPIRIAYGNSQLYENQKNYSMKMALNSARQVNELLRLATNEGVIDRKDSQQLTEKVVEVCKMISGMIKKGQAITSDGGGNDNDD
ncbi:four helix bundle protein [Bacillus tuaregi]|uniref:four helix bundle protein n=1 Tax=Bacillus tuaregi TaxID=1816695 RepID=UPI0008F87F49|nr:four helix bundle protein [Bacillus tuaregi]